MIPKVLYQFKDCAGTSFQPSNGTEGMIFMDAFCENCIHDNVQKEKYCEIIVLTMCFSPKDKEYPKEWIFNEEGWPVCTKWKKWDWGSGDDLNEPPEPPYEPQDPNQLMLFSVADYVLQNHQVKRNVSACT